MLVRFTHTQSFEQSFTYDYPEGISLEQVQALHEAEMRGRGPEHEEVISVPGLLVASYDEISLISGEVRRVTHTFSYIDLTDGTDDDQVSSATN